jgi:hypothetical protein
MQSVIQRSWHTTFSVSDYSRIFLLISLFSFRGMHFAVSFHLPSNRVHRRQVFCLIKMQMFWNWFEFSAEWRREGRRPFSNHLRPRSVQFMSRDRIFLIPSAVDVKNGDLMRATFPDEGPDMNIRSASNFVGPHPVASCPFSSDVALRILFSCALFTPRLTKVVHALKPLGRPPHVDRSLRRLHSQGRSEIKFTPWENGQSILVLASVVFTNALSPVLSGLKCGSNPQLIIIYWTSNKPIVYGSATNSYWFLLEFSIFVFYFTNLRDFVSLDFIIRTLPNFSQLKRRSGYSTNFFSQCWKMHKYVPTVLHKANLHLCTVYHRLESPIQIPLW